MLIEVGVMASVQYHRLNWSGWPYLPPGSQHNWWLVHSSWRERGANLVYSQVNVSAHPWVWLPHYHDLAPAELTVDNLRSRLNAAFGRVMYFTVRNSGPNPVAFYGVGISLIDE